MAEVVPPLDAYKTAKPDEPIWTVQGGDPLGPPLLRLWAVMARVRAGVLSPKAFTTDWAEGVKEVAENHSVQHDERAREELLIRATKTEEISWDMDSYQQGTGAKAETSIEKSSVREQLDLFDLRVLSADRLGSMFSELNTIREQLEQAPDFRDRDYALLNLENVIRVLRLTYNHLQPRRERQIKDVGSW